MNLERRYMEHALSKLMEGDRVSSCWHSAISFLYVAAVLLKRRVSEIEVFYVSLWKIHVYAVLALVHALWVRWAPLGTFRRWRTPAVLGIRLMYAYCFSTGSLPFYQIDTSQETLLSFWVKCILNLSLLDSFWLAMGFPLVFKWQVFVHSLIVWYEMKTLLGRFCSAVSIPEDPVQTWVSRTMDSGLASLTGLRQLSGLHFLLHNTGYLLLPGGYNPSTKPMPWQLVCTGSLQFLQLAVSWWLPLVLLYNAERKVRMYFLLCQEPTSEVGLISLEVEQVLQESMKPADQVYRVTALLLGFIQSLSLLILLWHIVVRWV